MATPCPTELSRSPDSVAKLSTQDQVGRLYREPEEWTRKAILNVAGMGIFSSDRTIAEYAGQIWNAGPVGW